MVKIPDRVKKRRAKKKKEAELEKNRAAARRRLSSAREKRINNMTPRMRANMMNAPKYIND